MIGERMYNYEMAEGWKKEAYGIILELEVLVCTHGVRDR